MQFSRQSQDQVLVETGRSGISPLSSGREKEAGVQGGGRGTMATDRSLSPEVGGMMDGVVPVIGQELRRRVAEGGQKPEERRASAFLPASTHVSPASSVPSSGGLARGGEEPRSAEAWDRALLPDLAWPSPETGCDLSSYSRLRAERGNGDGREWGGLTHTLSPQPGRDSKEYF